jgi:hypothetical protein
MKNKNILAITLAVTMGFANWANKSHAKPNYLFESNYLLVSRHLQDYLLLLSL